MVLELTSTVSDGFLRLRTNAGVNLPFYVPVVKNASLDHPAGIQIDALTTCRDNVPAIEGIAEAFRAELRAFAPTGLEMLEYFDFTAAHLMNGCFDPNNPGHVFVAMQCFGGWWAGIATQSFSSAMLKLYSREIERIAGRPVPGKELDMFVSVVGCICKAMGCSARCPLTPRWPTGGSPPDPVYLLADSIMARHPGAIAGDLERLQLVSALRSWHVPRCVRDCVKDYSRIWLPQSQVDRTKTIVELQLRHFS